jgi:hypothetical protein
MSTEVEVRWSPGFQKFYATIPGRPHLFAYGATPLEAERLVLRRELHESVEEIVSATEALAHRLDGDKA